MYSRGTPIYPNMSCLSSFSVHLQVPYYPYPSFADHLWPSFHQKKHCSCGLSWSLFALDFKGLNPHRPQVFLLAYWYFNGMYVHRRSRDLVYQWTAIYPVTPPPIHLSFRADALTSLNSTQVSHFIFIFQQLYYLHSLRRFIIIIIAHYELSYSCLGLRLLEILIQNTSKPP